MKLELEFDLFLEPLIDDCYLTLMLGDRGYLNCNTRGGLPEKYLMWECAYEVYSSLVSFTYFEDALKNNIKTIFHILRISPPSIFGLTVHLILSHPGTRFLRNRAINHLLFTPTIVDDLGESNELNLRFKVTSYQGDISNVVRDVIRDKN